MNEVSIRRIERAARFLRTPTAKAARGYLARPLESALKVLDCLEDGKPHTHEEIAEMSGMNEKSVRQILAALDRGGYGLTFSPSLGWKPKPQGGRPIVAAQTRQGVKR